MLVLGTVLVIAIGFLAVNCISVKFTWSEKIGLAFPVGIGLQTMMMLIINLLKIKLITASVMLGGVLILLLLLSFLYKRRDGVIMYYKKLSVSILRTVTLSGASLSCLLRTSSI